MVRLIRPFFYWPSLTSDCLKVIKGWDICQRLDKTKPHRNKMQLTVPFERVVVDLVGPFPTATGGYRFLLTVIDLATRWPEGDSIQVSKCFLLVGSVNVSLN